MRVGPVLKCLFEGRPKKCFIWELNSGSKLLFIYLDLAHHKL